MSRIKNTKNKNLMVQDVEISGAEAEECESPILLACQIASQTKAAVNDKSTNTTPDNQSEELDQQQVNLPVEVDSNNEQNRKDGEVKVISVDTFDPSTGETTTETVALTPSKMESMKTFISDFAKEYYKNPLSPARAMKNQIDEIRLEVLLDRAEANMTDEQIYQDFQELLQCGLLLNEDYSKHSDEANLRLKATLERHAPEIMKEIESRKKIIDEVK